MACDSCAGALYSGVSVIGIYDDVTGCPLIGVSGSPAVASINVSIVNAPDVNIINVPEVTINGVGTTCIGAAAGSPNSHLGTAGQYALLGYSGITNSGSSVISGGNIGSFPTDSVTGFPPGVLVPPSAYVTATAQNQTDLAAAITYYNGLPVTQVLTTADMGTQMSIGAPVGTYYAGVYASASSLAIDTPITLDAQGNPNAIFVFTAVSTIVQQIAGTITLINGANPCNVIWVANSSWTSIGPGAVTVGTILAYASVTLGGGSLNGRALANTGAVTISTAETITNACSSSVGTCGLDVFLINSCISVCGATFTEVGSPAVSSLNTFITGGDVTVSGDVCVTQCTSPWVVSGSVTVSGTVAVTQGGPFTVTVENTPTTPIFVCQGTCATPFTIDLTEIGGVPVGFTIYGSPATAALDVFVTNGLSIDVATVTCGPETFALGSSQVLQLAPSGALITIPSDEQFACSIQYYSYDSGAAFNTSVMTTAFVPLWSIQGNGTGAFVQLIREMEIFTDGSNIQFELIEGGALTGAAFAAGPGNTNVDTSATTVTGGIVVWSGYVGAVPRNFDNMLDCLNGKTYTIAAKSFKGCAKVVAQVRWSEQASICG